MLTANKPRTIAHRRNRAALNWIDFLVIAAIILTAVGIVSTTLARAKAAPLHAVTSAAISTEVSQHPSNSP